MWAFAKTLLKDTVLGGWILVPIVSITIASTDFSQVSVAQLKGAKVPSALF
jgi:hypothetical protein